MNNITLFRKLGTISRASMNEMNKLARPYNLDNNLFLYLFRIVENPGLSLSELVELVKYEKSTISRALKKLEAMDLITKETNPENKKYILLHPTKKAMTIYNTLSQDEKTYTSNSLSPLSEEEKTTLLNLLNKITPSKDFN